MEVRVFQTTIIWISLVNIINNLVYFLTSLAVYLIFLCATYQVSLQDYFTAQLYVTFRILAFNMPIVFVVNSNS